MGEYDDLYPKRVRLLFYDVETAPMLAHLWTPKTEYVAAPMVVDDDRNLLCWSAKWSDSQKVHSARLTKREAQGQDDVRIVSKLADLMRRADYVVGHNCVEMSTPVLTRDLRWIPAGDLRPGDELVAFSEDKPAKNTPRQFEVSTIIANSIEEQACWDIHLDSGEVLTATADHQWLKLAPKGREFRWATTEQLRVGQRLEKYFEPWQPNKSYEAGWLAGFMAGEGSLSGNHQSGGLSVQICQRPGSTWDTALRYAQLLDVPLTPGRTPKTGGLGRRDTLYANTTGGKLATLEMLGRLRIDRLIENIDWSTFGKLAGRTRGTAIITAIKPAGFRRVAVLQTTTGTFFGAGYPMHNCNRFDYKRVNTRLLVNKLTPLGSVQSVDTLLIARQSFDLPYNNLDYLARKLGFGKKLSTSFDLWRRSVMGDTKALREMSDYCNRDVILLEHVFHAITPYAKTLPRLVDAAEWRDELCPYCGATDRQRSGVHRTKVNNFPKYVCGKCQREYRGWQGIGTRKMGGLGL